MTDSAHCFEHDGVNHALDAEGFLLDPEAWTPALGEALAAASGIPELTDEHRRVMDFVRTHWRDHGVAPMIRHLCRETGLSLGRIYELFPDGPAHGACRFAGLPRPDGCV